MPKLRLPGGMAKPVDAADLKSAGRKAVGVQVPLPPSVMFDPQLERELEQARQHGRWLADDERAALDQERQDALARANRHQQTRRKLLVLTGVCLLLPPLWPLALGLTLYLLFPRTTKRFGLMAGVIVLAGAAVLMVLVLSLLVAILMLVF